MEPLDLRENRVGCTLLMSLIFLSMQQNKNKKNILFAFFAYDAQIERGNLIFYF